MSDEKKPLANILSKIVQAIRDDAQVLSDAVMDSRGTKGFEKQIEVARDKLQQAKHAITREMAKEMQSSRKVRHLRHRVLEQEQWISKALNDKDDELALKLATDMVDMESDLEAETSVLDAHQLHLGHLTRQLENAERSLKDLERQVAMVKTTQSIQQATAVITKNLDAADAKMLSAKRALERIRKKQLNQQQSTQDEFGLSVSADPESQVQRPEYQSLEDQRHKDAEDVIKRIKGKE